VLIETARGEERWSTIGVSQNIIEASTAALADAFELPLARARPEAGAELGPGAAALASGGTAR
jgi:2-isopropylmalate synthase